MSARFQLENWNAPAQLDPEPSQLELITIGHLYYRCIGLLEVAQSKQHHLQFSMGHNPDDLQNWQPSLLLNKTKSLNSWNSKIIRYFIIYGNLVDSPDRTSDELPKWHGHMQHCKKVRKIEFFKNSKYMHDIFMLYIFSWVFKSQLLVFAF